MSQTLEQRVEALEKRPAPRGPAGDISAAVRNAEIAASKIVEKAEAPIGAKAEASYVKFIDEVTKLQTFADKLYQEVAELRKFLDERIHNTVDLQVVQTLQDYHLLDNNYAPTHWSK